MDDERQNNCILVNNKNHVFHSYLIELENYDLSKKEIYHFLKYLLGVDNDKIIYLIETETYPEIVYIRPENKLIKKEQLIELQKKFKEKPVLGKYLIYVIEGAECLNSSSANTMLKFLEEPEENIIAILLAKNKYNVLETIVSRCQCINLNNELDFQKGNDDSLQLLNLIEKNKESSIALLGYLYFSKNFCLEMVDGFINDFIFVYNNVLNNLVNDRIIDVKYNIIVENNSIYTINEKIKILLELKNDIEYNVNAKMFLDMLILKVSEVEND